MLTNLKYLIHNDAKAPAIFSLNYKCFTYLEMDFTYLKVDFTY